MDTSCKQTFQLHCHIYQIWIFDHSWLQYIHVLVSVICNWTTLFEKYYCTIQFTFVYVINVCKAIIILWTVKMSLNIDTGHNVGFLWFKSDQKINKQRRNWFCWFIIFFLLITINDKPNALGSYRVIFTSTKYDFLYFLRKLIVISQLYIEVDNWNLSNPVLTNLSIGWKLKQRKKNRLVCELIM